MSTACHAAAMLARVHTQQTGGFILPQPDSFCASTATPKVKSCCAMSCLSCLASLDTASRCPSCLSRRLPALRCCLQVPRVKYSFWNHDYSLVALASKHTIVIATKQLDQL